MSRSRQQLRRWRRYYAYRRINLFCTPLLDRLQLQSAAIAFQSKEGLLSSWSGSGSRAHCHPGALDSSGSRNGQLPTFEILKIVQSITKPPDINGSLNATRGCSPTCSYLRDGRESPVPKSANAQSGLAADDPKLREQPNPRFGHFRSGIVKYPPPLATSPHHLRRTLATVFG